jgi:hypothetical protein
MDARLKTVLLPTGGGVAEYAPQSLGHYVGLMFFPWLDGRGHHNAALQGGWTLMEAWNGGDAARRTEWRPSSVPWLEDCAEACAAMAVTTAIGL